MFGDAGSGAECVVGVVVCGVWCWVLGGALVLGGGGGGGVGGVVVVQRWCTWG